MLLKNTGSDSRLLFHHWQSRCFGGNSIALAARLSQHHLTS